jgi:hypothetical protein
MGHPAKAFLTEGTENHRGISLRESASCGLTAFYWIWITLAGALALISDVRTTTRRANS